MHRYTKNGGHTFAFLHKFNRFDARSKPLPLLRSNKVCYLETIRRISINIFLQVDLESSCFQRSQMLAKLFHAHVGFDIMIM